MKNKKKLIWSNTEPSAVHVLFAHTNLFECSVFFGSYEKSAFDGLSFD